MRQRGGTVISENMDTRLLTGMVLGADFKQTNLPAFILDGDSYGDIAKKWLRNYLVLSLRHVTGEVSEAKAVEIKALIDSMPFEKVDEFIKTLNVPSQVASG